MEASLGGRYATALFDLARESKAVDTVEASLRTLDGAVAENADLRALVSSPVIARQDAVRAMSAVAQALGLDATTTGFLGVLARNGRLKELQPAIRAFRRLAARYRGEETAEVISAHPLTDEQVAALRQKLKARTGRNVAVEARVDPAILGGLVVKLGSQRIDSSLRTRLNTLAQAMKG